jgi:hypothetical protein
MKSTDITRKKRAQGSWVMHLTPAVQRMEFFFFFFIKIRQLEIYL